MADNSTEKYKITPTFILEKRPIPTPEIANAAEGLFDITLRASRSDFDILPLSYFSVADFMPRGKPHRFPSKNDGIPSELMPKDFSKIFPILEFVLISMTEFQRSERIKKGKSVGIMLKAQSLNPSITPALIGPPK